MIGGVSQWSALVLLLVWASAPASVEGVDELTLVSMDWTYDKDATSTFLTVCTQETSLEGTITLTLTDSTSQVLYGPLDGSLVDGDDTCAKFNTSGYKTLPAEETTYKLSTESEQQQKSGSVTFLLQRATITCGSSKFLRFNPSAGTVDGVTCINFSEDLDSVCYVAKEDVPADPICFTGIDEGSPNFQVCIEKETFALLDSYDGSFTADELNYKAKSFAFTFDEEDLKEVLILSNETGMSPTVVSCDADNTCVDKNFASSTAYYDLCGVFVDEEGMAVNSSIAHFQDTDLRVDTVEPTVDFHFIKVEDNEVYLVSGLDANNDPIDEVTLDCSYITPGTICNGFFAANDKIKNVAVSYDDGTNKIIAQVPETRTFQIRNHLP